MMNELRQIARNAHTRRPEWDLAGILTVLARLDITHPGLDGAGDPARIRAATERAALDPRAKTPAAITFARYWNAPTANGARFRECARCSAPHPAAAPTPARCHACRRPWRERNPE